MFRCRIKKRFGHQNKNREHRLTGKLLIDWLERRNRVDSHRQLVLISGRYEWCAEQLSLILNHKTQRSLLISKHFINQDSRAMSNQKGASPALSIDAIKPTLTHIEVSQYKQHLGAEFDLVIYDAFDGVKPSALYALEGTIGRGGLLILLCPELSDWPDREAISPGISFSATNKHYTSLFIKRMLNLIYKQGSAGFLSETKQHLDIDIYEESKVQAQTLEKPVAVSVDHSVAYSKPVLSEHSAVSITNLTDQQQQALNKLLSSLTNKECPKGAVGLIKAKRGRGKSTLLGRLAAEFAVVKHETAIFITAPHLNNCQRALAEFKATVNAFNKLNLDTRPRLNTRLTYIAPDQILTLNKAAMLFIDEAASISPRIILNACQYFGKVVLATTVEGYEGSGLGFTLKVLPKLQALTDTFTLVELSQAIRWFPNDSLELLFENVFAPLIGDEDKALDLKEADINSNDLNKLHLRLIDKTELINSESSLKAILGLLVQSHYQTTPDDIMRILDAPDHHIAILTNSKKTNSALNSNAILSVAVLVDESLISTNIDEDFLDNIICSSRRINGHLVAQNLASTFSDIWFLNSRNWRIMRIAVQPHLRRLGLASSMLSQIEKLAKEQDVNYISTSFGFTNELYSFWQSQHYKLIKIGARRDTSSGEHSSIWVFPMNASAASQFKSYLGIMLNDMDFLVNMILKNHIDEHWWLNNTRLLSDLETGLILLGGEGKKRTLKSILSEDEKKQETQQTLRTHHARLRQFVAGKRSYTNAAASVYYYFKQHGVELDLLVDIQQKNHSQAKKTLLINEIKLCVKKFI